MRARLGGGLYPIIFARYRFCGRNMNFLLTGMPWQAIRYGLRRSNTILWALDRSLFPARRMEFGWDAPAGSAHQPGR